MTNPKDIEAEVNELVRDLSAVGYGIKSEVKARLLGLIERAYAEGRKDTVEYIRKYILGIDMKELNDATVQFEVKELDSFLVEAAKGDLVDKGQLV